MTNLTKPALIAVLAVAGCAPTLPPVQVVGVQAVALLDVTECEPLGWVTGRPGLYGAFSEIGIREARKAALESARDSGGNRVVFDPLPEVDEDAPEPPVVALRGRVYKC